MSEQQLLPTVEQDIIDQVEQEILVDSNDKNLDELLRSFEIDPAIEKAIRKIVRFPMEDDFQLYLGRGVVMSYRTLQLQAKKQGEELPVVDEDIYGAITADLDELGFDGTKQSISYMIGKDEKIKKENPLFYSMLDRYASKDEIIFGCVVSKQIGIWIYNILDNQAQANKLNQQIPLT